MTDATGRKRRKVGANSQRDTAPEKQSLTQSHDTIYDGGGDKFAGYETSIAVNDNEDDDDVEMENGNDGRLVGQYTASASQMNEFTNGGPDDVDMIESREQKAQIQSRESDYQKRRFNRALSPTRKDPFAQDGGDQEGTTYKDIVAARELEREESRVHKLIADKEKSGDIEMVEHEATLKIDDKPHTNGVNGKKEESDSGRKRKKRWDIAPKDDDDQTVATTAPTRKSRWDQVGVAPSIADTTTTTATRRSRWDQAPAVQGQSQNEKGDANNVAALPTLPGRYRPLTDEELDSMLPGKAEGFIILDPPPGYEPAQQAARKAPPPSSLAGGFMMQEPERASSIKNQMPSQIPGVGELVYWKPEDQQYFGKLGENVDEASLSNKQVTERKILRLLLKIKNGNPPMRKTAIRQITDNAKSFGAEALFDAILPILMEKSLEDQERHLLVKVIDRVLYKLDSLVRPWVHKILVVIEPLLIDQDYYARVEGREIISNLSKAAGLAHMISTMRPDIDHDDEYVRNTTARAFAVVAYALGIPALLPFLRAVCGSRKTWQARHTGVKIVQQIPILMGCGVLPHLKGLVDCIAGNLNDEQQKVRTVSSLAVAALAEAANPYGIESFDDILNPLWTGARKQRGKPLAGFLKAVGYLIPLMDEEYASYYTQQIMTILQREFGSNDEEMKKVVLKVVSQCSLVPGVTSQYIKSHVLPEFYKAFWVRRTALDKRLYRQVVDTTVDLAKKVGPAELISQLAPGLRDESEPFRKMTMEVFEKTISTQGLEGLDTRLEELLVDGALWAYGEQTQEESIILNGLGVVLNGLGDKCQPYFPQVASAIFYRLDSKKETTRQQAADLVSRFVPVVKHAGDIQLINKFSEVLYEMLGEEYPEVLGSILGALRVIVPILGADQTKPPIKDLVLRLTPILRNRHEKVQENTIDLVGRVADRGPGVVAAREWMRICFELLDMLKAHKKGIRRAANNTFGYIAKAIGPQDVLATLLNNLRVQERQSRVCTAVAIGIVAETCAPFTVLPALMNEYRVPELNVQNGVLKSLSFLFEYIGEMAKDYVYAITPLLEDALIDRDQVHRQTAASVVKHIALGVAGLGCEDAMIHLLNLIFPNIFETSPHVIDRVVEAIEGIRVAVGPGPVLNYTWAGLFHPARLVRNPYWRVYNDCYVQSADAMIPYYPNLKELGGKRQELEVFV